MYTAYCNYFNLLVLNLFISICFPLVVTINKLELLKLRFGQYDKWRHLLLIF